MLNRNSYDGSWEREGTLWESAARHPDMRSRSPAYRQRSMSLPSNFGTNSGSTRLRRTRTPSITRAASSSQNNVARSNIPYAMVPENPSSPSWYPSSRETNRPNSQYDLRREKNFARRKTRNSSYVNNTTPAGGKNTPAGIHPFTPGGGIRQALKTRRPPWPQIRQGIRQASPSAMVQSPRKNRQSYDIYASHFSPKEFAYIRDSPSLPGGNTPRQNQNFVYNKSPFPRNEYEYINKYQPRKRVNFTLPQNENEQYKEYSKSPYPTGSPDSTRYTYTYNPPTPYPPRILPRPVPRIPGAGSTPYPKTPYPKTPYPKTPYPKTPYPKSPMPHYRNLDNNQWYQLASPERRSPALKERDEYRQQEGDNLEKNFGEIDNFEHFAARRKHLRLGGGKYGPADILHAGRIHQASPKRLVTSRRQSRY